MTVLTASLPALADEGAAPPAAAPAAPDAPSPDAAPAPASVPAAPAPDAAAVPAAPAPDAAAVPAAPAPDATAAVPAAPAPDAAAAVPAAPAPDATAAPAAPAPAAAAAPPLPPQPSPEELARTRWSELRLTRVPDLDAGGWDVRDGRGTTVDAHTLALLAGDSALLQEQAEAKRLGHRKGWLFVGGGAAVALCSLVPVLTMEDTLVANEGTPAFQDLGRRNDVRTGVAFGLVGAGSVLAASGVALQFSSDLRLSRPSAHLTEPEADALLAGYNARLSELLRVPSDTPAAAATVEAPPAPEADPLAEPAPAVPAPPAPTP